MNKQVLIGMACCALLSACGQQQNSGAPAGPMAGLADKTPVVSVAAAVLQTVPQESVYSASVQANVVNNIAPQSGGRIQKLNVEVGDFVSAGQVLAEMDRVQLDQATLRLKNDETELARVKQLFAEGGVSQSDYEALELAFKVSKSSYENLQENTILRAPVSGVVSARNYDRGDLYSMGQPIYTVQQITPVKLLVPISEADYTRVKRGGKVSLTADALPGKSYTGTIVRLYPTMDPATHTFNAEVRVANEKRELRPGMYARVTVDYGARERVVVPDAAVIRQQGSGQRSVFVLNADDTVTLKVVEAGRHFGTQYEILSGLEAGEQVLTGGFASLKSGDKVEVKR
ncbi:MAG: efflux RND transporter periplasmic adaptor subunit [Bacteroidales bacterium]|nr:efflux RND transporter periplasmic adaptor subunit [Bacteroidales bacterium]